ncbi:MAG: enoyl-CoA hydratase/isomerase family protein [Planctomycetota bacterium]
MSELATLTFDGPSATLTLNRPDQRNALSTDLLAAAHRCMDELEAKASPPTVLVVTGAGKSFCAGMDLKQVIIEDAGGVEVPKALLTSLARLTHRLRLLPSVTVARVNGAAIGGGCGLACVCDIAVTHADSTLGFPEVDLALCPAVVAPWLVRKIGAGPARRVLLSGGVMSGNDAHKLGMIDVLATSLDELDTATNAAVRSLCSGGPLALRATKELVNTLDGSLDLDVLLRGAELSATVLSTDDAQARLRARRK